ncbi:MAG TPA: hypothetical protein EYG66_00670 [Mariprofundaceae bacterium]|nr:hypothetical protein [Mariprofundaceae bacterium]
MKKIFIIPSLLLFSFAAQTHAADIRPVISLGYDVDTGSDVMFTGVFTDGSTDEITGGEGVVFAAGLYVPIEDDMGVQATIGYKWDSIDAQNGTIDFTRIPIDVLAFKHFSDKHSIAAGGTYHLSPTFTCEVTAVCTGSVEFDSALGFIAEYTYAVKSNKESGMKIGVRYTNISYETSAVTQTFDGSSIGLILYAY